LRSPEPRRGGDVTQARRALLSITIANTLEWYDFAIYAFLAQVIAGVMFPASDAMASLLLSVGSFGVGFLTRPAGSVIFGALADSKGRKLTLMLTFLLMGIATLAIGVIPSFAAIGLTAPLLVVLARLLQGLAAGGAMGGATSLLIEHAPPDRAGYFGSWQVAGQAGALLMGALAAATVSAVVKEDQLVRWGWRLPFLASALLLPFALYTRRRVEDSQAFVCERRAATSPLRILWRTRRGAVARGFGITVIWTVATYFFFIYVPLYAHTVLKMPMSTTLFSNSIALLVLLVVSPMAGHLSDRLSRLGIMVAAAVAMVVLTVPGFQLLLSHSSGVALVTFQITFAALAALFVGPAPAAIAELFPVGVRSSGVGVAYNCAVTVFGGFAPLIATGLVALTTDPLSPTWYVVFSCSLSLLALMLTPRTRSQDPC